MPRSRCGGCSFRLFAQEWSSKYLQALGNFEDARLKSAGLPNAIDSAMDELECQMVLQGATAVEVLADASALLS